MRYQRRLQDQLVEQFHRLRDIEWRSYSNQAGYFVDFILQRPALRHIVQSLEASLPDLDPAQWIENTMTDKDYAWPPTEAGKLKVCWYMLTQIAQEKVNPQRYSFRIAFSTRNVADSYITMTEQVVKPLVEYLLGEIEDQSNVLYLLEKYQRRVAWFEQDRLWAELESAQASGGQTKAEDIYDKDLRKFLFEQGVDYPFSQPVSASGRADIIADVETNDPLVCEIKLFNGTSYGVGYLAKGLNQANGYALDYGKTTAYLVIINLTDRMLELPTDGSSDDWPPKLIVGGVTIFLVVVQGKPLPSASKRGMASPLVVTRQQLVAISEE